MKGRVGLIPSSVEAVPRGTFFQRDSFSSNRNHYTKDLERGGGSSFQVGNFGNQLENENFLEADS